MYGKDSSELACVVRYIPTWGGWGDGDTKMLQSFEEATFGVGCKIKGIKEEDVPVHLRKYVKALKMYVGVLESVPSGSRKTNNLNWTETSNRFLFLLHFLNKNFNHVDAFHGSDGQHIVNDDPQKYEETLKACKELFSGNGTLTGFEIVQKLWDIPPTLLETIIPIAIARDFLSCRKLRFFPASTIVVHGKTTKPWNDFVLRYSVIILES
jgi:hypothetical protein